MSVTIDGALGGLAHPRIQERREAVDQQRQRKLQRRAGAALCVASMALAAGLALQSPLFDVDEVRVIGASARTSDHVRTVAEIDGGEPLFRLDLEGPTERVEQLASVATATISKDWEGTVLIEVEERVGVARLSSPEGTIVLSEDGMVLSVDDRPHSHLPLIAGAMLSIEAGRWAPAELNEALAVAAALPDDVERVVERVELSVDDLALRLVGGGTVGLGDGRNLEAKFDAVRAFLAHAELRCLDHIDVAAPQVPVLARQQACR